MRAVSVFCLFVAGLSSLPLSVAAEEEIRLDGPVLIFDTENVEDDPDADISGGDVGVILKLLRGNPDIRTVRLNSYGGDIYAGSRLADILIDFEVETEVKDVCDSTCVTLFLAGTKRRLPRGAKTGFIKPPGRRTA